MALLKTQGIVLKKLNYGETSLIADIYTEEHGLQSFIASGVRKAKSRMPLSFFQAMSPVELVAYFKEDTQKLHRIKEVRSSLILQQVPFDFRRGAIALFMAEVCQNTVKETESNPDLFSFLFEYMSWLDKTPQKLANLHLHFIIHLTKHLGFQPSERLGSESFFDLREGRASNTPPSHMEYFSGDAVDFLFYFLKIQKEEAHTIEIGPLDRKLLLQHLLNFYRSHSPGFREIQTPKILAQVFT